MANQEGNTFWGNPTNAGNLPGSQINTTQAFTSNAQSSTITTSRTDLVGSTPIAWIRSNVVNVNVVDTKPNTRLYAFFDGEAVGEWMQQNGKAMGDPLITDATGQLNATFTIKGNKFRTGQRVLRLQDTAILDTSTVPGSMVGSASATYSTQGVKETYKTTHDSLQTITLNIIDPPPADVIDEVTTITTTTTFQQVQRNTGRGPADPLAQSFFTHGVSGGVFITSLDLFFATKDTTLPVWVEIREMVNGYPGRSLVNPFATCTLKPASVNVSANSSVATRFTFDIPLYLKENSDYCFVVRSNSSGYNIYTSKIGERALENNLIIFEQPFLGSMFKSQNDFTWTAEQSEDIKFTLNQAKFDTSSTTSSIKFIAKATPLLLMGSNFLVKAGSNTITVCTMHQHGMKTNDVITLAAKEGGVFRGIPKANLTGNFSITLISDYVFSFQCASVATSDGTLACPGFVNEIIVDDGGTGYNTLDCSVQISGGIFTSPAQAVPVIVGGKIVAINLTNVGSGYTVAPTVTVLGTHTANMEVQAKLVCESIFVLTTNNIVAGYQPQVVTHVPAECSISTDLITTSETYTVSPATTIEDGYYEPKSPSILVSPQNSIANINNSIEPAGTSVLLKMSSSNPNVSPLIVVSEQPKLSTYAYIINNQTNDEDLTSSNASASVISATIVGSNFGTGFTVGNISVIVDPPHIAGGVQAVVTGNIVGGTVTSLNLVTPGSGYLRTPNITITGGTQNAIGILGIGPFNSELLPSGGSARSKYLTKQFQLAQVSKGAQVILTAISMPESNVDVYIRTSLTSNSLIHTNQNWTKMSCEVERNRSRTPTEQLDYTFTTPDLPPFDVYDIKLVLRSTNRMIVPTINSYRVIILAT
jgi:hypothetical protein